MTDEEGRAQMMDDAQGRPPRPALQTPRLPGYSAADLVHIMAGMREHGIARMHAGELRLELGAQAPSAAVASALRLARQMDGHPVPPASPAVTGPVQLEPPAEPAARPPSPAPGHVEEEDFDDEFPTAQPPAEPLNRKALAGLREDDPLLNGVLPRGGSDR